MKRIAWWLAVVLVLAALPVSVSADLNDLMKWTKSKVGEVSAEKLIAYFRVNGAVAETPTEMPPLFGDQPPVSLKDLLERLKQARQDPAVVAVVLDVQEAALGSAQIEELHEALGKFAAVDKEVFVHTDSLHTGTYATATAASHISIVPTGDLWLVGLYSEAPYLRGALDKLGIVPDMEHCGDFKTGAEFLTRTGPSDESKKMSQWLLDGIYDSMVERMAKSRKIPPQKMRQLIDNGPYSAEEALKAGLIDSVKQRQDFVKHLKDKYGKSVRIASDYGDDKEQDIPEDFFAMMTWLMDLLNPSPKVHTAPSVAIVFVEGLIQTGSAPTSPFGSTGGAYSTTIRKALDQAAGDDSVKAVVLRVDSPGGSALASEIIWDATRRLAARKPFVVSMGNVAGSGGYYVSCGAETIFADAMTITASIGVLGGKFVTTAGWDKLGIQWHAEQRGAMAGMMGSAQPFSEKERAKIRHYMESVYGVFKQHVVDGRKGKLTKPIVEIAGGRVFTGRQALELGLVDQIGGLDDAIKFTAGRAGVSDYEIRVIPEPPNIFQLFMDPQSNDEFAGALGVEAAGTPRIASFAQELKGREADAIRRILGASLPGLSPGFDSIFSTLAGIDPIRAKAFIKIIQGATMLNEEKILLFMPDPLIR